MGRVVMRWGTRLVARRPARTHLPGLAGTSDVTTYLSIGATLDFRARLPGGERAILAYTRDLSARAAEHLASTWHTETLVPSHSPLRPPTMFNVRLPTSNRTAAAALGDQLVGRYGTWVPVLAHEWMPTILPEGTYWARVSCTVYNSFDEYVRLGDAVIELLGGAKVLAAR